MGLQDEFVAFERFRVSGVGILCFCFWGSALAGYREPENQAHLLPPYLPAPEYGRDMCKIFELAGCGPENQAPLLPPYQRRDECRRLENEA